MISNNSMFVMVLGIGVNVGISKNNMYFTSHGRKKFHQSSMWNGGVPYCYGTSLGLYCIKMQYNTTYQTSKQQKLCRALSNNGGLSTVLSTSSSISRRHSFIFSSFRSFAPMTSCNKFSCLNVRWNVTPHNLVGHFTKQLACIMLSFHLISEHGWLSISCCIGLLKSHSNKHQIHLIDARI